MRLAIDTSSVSFRLVGSLLAVAGVILLVSGLFVRWLLAPGLLLSASGVLLRGSRRYIVRHPQAAVLKQLARTLDLMGWKYERQGDSISVPSTGTIVQVRPLSSLALMSFKFGGAAAQKEKYLAATLVKYQRFQGS
jgi:hypothetical protein